MIRLHLSLPWLKPSGIVKTIFFRYGTWFTDKFTWEFEVYYSHWSHLFSFVFEPRLSRYHSCVEVGIEAFGVYIGGSVYGPEKKVSPVNSVE